jgi:hypothetical protein
MRTVAFTVEVKFINRSFFADHPGKCYDSNTNAAYAVGETWRPAGSCQEYKCNTAPENSFQIDITG